MTKSQLFENLQILYGSKQSPVNEAALISGRKIKAFGEKARKLAKESGAKIIQAKGKILAPCLVDPHSVLDNHLQNKIETLESLRDKACKGGYGQIALLPRSSSWRDRPERIIMSSKESFEVLIHSWGSFTLEGKARELSPHSNLINHGVIGLAEDDSMLPIDLLKKGFLLGEFKSKPILLAPRDKELQGDGMVREGIETLQAGWPPDPIASETIPLGQLLELSRQHPEISMRLMNISTKIGTEILARSQIKPIASVNWWHLVSDSTKLHPNEIGWKVNPSLGGRQDREALIQALWDETLSAVSVHAIPLCDEEAKRPKDKRKPGITGHELVLSSLWSELVIKSGWSIEKLWKALSFGPSKMLGLPEEKLECESNRWVLFDTQKEWVQKIDRKNIPNAPNQPWEGKMMVGKVIDCGLNP